MDKDLNIGQLNRRVKILTPVVINTGGSVSTVWTELNEVWGKIEFGTGNEEMASDKVTARAQAIITIRYYSAVKEKMQAKENGVSYDVLNVAHFNRKYTILKVQRTDQ